MLKPSLPHSALRLAISPGVSQSLLVKLLALQRFEEPLTHLRIFEVSPKQLQEGMKDGHFDIALCSNSSDDSSERPEILCQEELGLAVPLRSPLLLHSQIPIELLFTYVVLPWQPCIDHPLIRSIVGHASRATASPQPVKSFEVMATLVAAGYGVGIAPVVRIEQARKWSIVKRVAADGPHILSTELLQARQPHTPAGERFAERARKIRADTAKSS